MHSHTHLKCPRRDRECAGLDGIGRHRHGTAPLFTVSFTDGRRSNAHVTATVSVPEDPLLVLAGEPAATTRTAERREPGTHTGSPALVTAHRAVELSPARCPRSSRGRRNISAPGRRRCSRKSCDLWMPLHQERSPVDMGYSGMSLLTAVAALLKRLPTLWSAHRRVGAETLPAQQGRRVAMQLGGLADTHRSRKGGCVAGCSRKSRPPRAVAAGTRIPAPRRVGIALPPARPAARARRTSRARTRSAMLYARAVLTLATWARNAPAAAPSSGADDGCCRRWTDPTGPSRVYRR